MFTMAPLLPKHVHKSTTLSGCIHQNLKKNIQMFYTFDWQTPIIGCYFRHWIISVALLILSKTFKLRALILNKETDVCNVCLQNNFKVYFCMQI